MGKKNRSKIINSFLHREVLTNHFTQHKKREEEEEEEAQKRVGWRNTKKREWRTPMPPVSRTRRRRTKRF